MERFLELLSISILSLIFGICFFFFMLKSKKRKAKKIFLIVSTILNSVSLFFVFYARTEKQSLLLKKMFFNDLLIEFILFISAISIVSYFLTLIYWHTKDFLQHRKEKKIEKFNQKIENLQSS